MPSLLKGPSAGRLLASLRQPARAGPLPVQTGFPTSLADLIVKNHGRLQKPKKRRLATAPLSPAPPVAAADPPPELSPVQDAPRRKGAAFSISPELFALGGAVALALMVIWSKKLVAAVTVASLSLLLIESVRSASRRLPRPRPVETIDSLDLCGRGRVSPIREVESGTETPRSICADSSLWAGERSDLGGDDSISPKRKEKRSLRKLIAKKLHSGKKQPKEKGPSGKQPDAAGEVGSNAGPVKTDALVASTEQTSSESSKEEEEELDGRGGALPFAAFIPVVLVGLLAGKLPAVALTVLCVVFSSSVERLPSDSEVQNSDSLKTGGGCGLAD